MKQRYDSYKPSGINWIGDIPTHWDCIKTLYALSMPITDGPHETPQLFETGIPFISAEAISSGEIRFENMRGYISKDYYEQCCKKYIPKRNDIFMTKSGASTGRVALVTTNEIFTIWSPLAVFRVNNSVTNYKYLFYVLRSDCYQKQVENGWSYGTQQNIGMRTLEKLKVPFPPLAEQEEIAAWLDDKCGEIDAAIAKVNREIELIDELKQSEISRVVTRGLNPDAPLRPSGIDWIGDAPSHWKICRVKHLVKFNSGDTITSDQFSDNGIFPVYGANGYRGQFHKYNFENQRILIGRVGALCGNVHYTNEKIWCSEHALISLESFGGLSFDYHWLCRLFESMNLNQYGGGSAQPVIASSTLENLVIVYPPLSEQQAITDYLDKKCAEIDGLKAKLTKKREILTELRQSIISEVVTGKRKVI